MQRSTIKYPRIGTRVGKLVVRSIAPIGRPACICICDCGADAVVGAEALLLGRVVACKECTEVTRGKA